MPTEALWCLIMLLVRPGASDAAFAAATTTSRSATSTRPAPDLAEPCRRRAETIRDTLGPECRVWVDPPFVVAGDLPQHRLLSYGRHVIRHAAEAMWRQYFSNRPTEPITVLLFDSGEGYRAHAKRLYGDDRVPYYGYYKPECRTLLMNISTGGGTLVHELTHALIAYDFPEVPDWFNEGLASLHEQCDAEAWRRGELVGDVNWRLPDLQKAITAGRLRPLRELITADDFRGSLETLNYAQARYFCMYLQHRGVLAKLYRCFRDGHREDPCGLSFVEEVAGNRRIELIERDFLEWVARLRYPP